MKFENFNIPMEIKIANPKVSGTIAKSGIFFMILIFKRVCLYGSWGELNATIIDAIMKNTRYQIHISIHFWLISYDSSDNI